MQTTVLAQSCSVSPAQYPYPTVVTHSILTSAVFEGLGKAVLYTGDLRCEPWFVNAISRSPSLIEYTSGLKPLDTIYLDTSFTEDIRFQTKAEGIRELLQKVSRYPADTIFHFQAWTYG